MVNSQTYLSASALIYLLSLDPGKFEWKLLMKDYQSGLSKFEMKDFLVKLIKPWTGVKYPTFIPFI